jgi:protein gp37
LERIGYASYTGLTEKQCNGVRRFNGTVRCHDDMLEKPLHWRKPRMIFVNSMSDLFHPKVPFDFVDKVFAIMTLCTQHTFQVLTKRPERMGEYLLTIEQRPEERDKSDCPEFSLAPRIGRLAGDIEANLRHKLPMFDDRGCVLSDRCRLPIKNLWLGTTVENQQTADKRIPELLKCPAAVRFLSCEPLLGPIELSAFLRPSRTMECPCGHVFSSTEAQPCGCNPSCGCRSVGECYHDDSFTLMCPRCGECACDRMHQWAANGRLGEVAGSGFDWCLDPKKWSKGIDQVIVGAETGPGARPMDLDWARSIRDQCRSAGVGFYMKQVSGKGPIPDDLMIREFPSVDCGG